MFVVVVVSAQSRAPQPSATGSPPPSETVERTPDSSTLAPRPPLSTPSSVAPTTVPEVVEPLLLAASEPVALEIPVIGVQSPLQHLGLTPERRLEVPAPGPHYNEAAWYKYSSTPGSLGPAIILGHVDSAAEGPSVFFHLGDLQPDDEVFVKRADGQVAVFEVDAIRSYPKDDFPTELVYGATEHAALRLITCGGEFDSASGHYRDNIVVYASLVDSL